jgi:hypothetical protein
MVNDQTVCPQAAAHSAASKQDQPAVSRRAFLTKALCTGGLIAVGGAEMLTPSPARADILDFLNKLFDLDPVVLNYAHEMEELQAEFFERASISKAAAELEPRVRNVIYTIAAQDRAHFEILTEAQRKARSRGGGTFATRNASSSRRPRRFFFDRHVFQSPAMLLPAAVEIKELCVGAYHGAVDLVDKPTLIGAAAIAGVDGRHLAVLRELAGFDPVPFSFENQVSPQTIGNRLRRFGFRGGEQQEG